MGDWIGLVVIVLLLAGALFGLSHLSKPAKSLSQEEYEQRVAESRGFASAGAMAGLYALQKLLTPKAVEAIEVQRDLKAGFYNDQEKKGEGDEPDVNEKEAKLSVEQDDEEGDDV